MAQCKFDKAWIGPCNKDTLGIFCAEHAVEECCNCGEQATHECAETGGLVCGGPLCEKCEHTIGPDGCSSGMLGSAKLPDDMKTHCKKGEQRFLPWYMQK